MNPDLSWLRARFRAISEKLGEEVNSQDAHDAADELERRRAELIIDSLVDLPEKLATALEALQDIACYGDADANAHLRATGSYSLFDEPAAVAKARDTVDLICGPPPVRT
jgi:hypothetical protein